MKISMREGVKSIYGTEINNMKPVKFDYVPASKTASTNIFVKLARMATTVVNG